MSPTPRCWMKLPPRRKRWRWRSAGTAGTGGRRERGCREGRGAALGGAAGIWRAVGGVWGGGRAGGRVGAGLLRRPENGGAGATGRAAGAEDRRAEYRPRER